MSSGRQGVREKTSGGSYSGFPTRTFHSVVDVILVVVYLIRTVYTYTSRYLVKAGSVSKNAGNFLVVRCKTRCNRRC